MSHVAFDEVPKVDFQREIRAPTRIDPPLGGVYGLLDERETLNFFEKYTQLDNFLHPWDNQNNYPKTLSREVRYFMRDFYERHLIFLRSQVNKYIPLRFKDTLETDTLILEVRPNMAKRTELRAPKVDLRGISWDKFRTNSVLYGAQATVHFNYGDNDVYGEGMVKFQLKALSDGLETASLLASYLYLVEKMPNPYYSAVNARREFNYDDMWDRETELWSASTEENGLQRVVTRKVKELRIQGGRARTLLISENLNNWLIFQKDNILSFNPSDDDGAFNKIFGLKKVKKYGDETDIDILPGILMPDGFEWEPLQTYTIRGGVVEVGRLRDDRDYTQYKTLHSTRSVTDSDKRQLGSFSLQKCLDASHLFDSTGALKTQPTTSDKDMFSTNTTAGTKCDKFFHPLLEHNKDTSIPKVFHKEHVLRIAQALNSAYYTVASGTSKKTETELFTWFKRFMTSNGSKNGDEATFKGLNTTTANPPVFTDILAIATDHRYVYNGVDSGRVFGTFKNLQAFADSTAKASDLVKSTELRSKMKEFTEMITGMFDFIASMFGADCPYIKPTPVDPAFNIALSPEDYLLHQILPTIWTLDFHKTAAGFTALPAKPTGTTVITSSALFKVTYAPIVSLANDWTLKIEADIKSACDAFHLTLAPLVTAYLTTTITKTICNCLYQNNVPLTWFWLACQPKKEYIGESGIAIEAGGQTLSRSIAMPESRMGQSIEGAYYKMYYQAYIGVEPGLPENFGTFDNIHIVAYIGGDTTTPTEWSDKTSSKSKKHPSLFFVAVPHWWERPKNFVDISGEDLGNGIGHTRCIPNWTRYQGMWNLKSNKKSDTYANYISKRLPNDVMGQQSYRSKFKNFLLAYEPYFEINPITNEEIAVPETGFWKMITRDFFLRRYQLKSIIASRSNQSLRN